MILLSNLLSEDRTASWLVLCQLLLVVWLMIKQYIFATLEFSMTTSITKIAEATSAVKYVVPSGLACVSIAVTLLLLVLQAMVQPGVPPLEIMHWHA